MAKTLKPKPAAPTMSAETLRRLSAAARESAIAPDDLISSLSEMVARAGQLEAQLAKIDEERAAVSHRYNELLNELIPAAMADANMASFKTASGSTVSVMKEYGASLARGKQESETEFEQRKERALEWLDENGHEGIVKVSFDVRLQRGDTQSAESLTQALEELGVDYKRDEGVHSSTLKAFVKEQLENGDPLPLDLFRVSEFTRAKITAPKGK